MNDDNDGIVKCQKNSTTPPRCHSDQVDPLVFVIVMSATHVHNQIRRIVLAGNSRPTLSGRRRRYILDLDSVSQKTTKTGKILDFIDL